MEVLLSHGADLNATSTRCGIVQTPLWRAVADHDRPFTRRRNINSPKRAGRPYTNTLVQFLLENGADPNFCDPTYGISPLWLALKARSDPAVHEEKVRALLEHGADVKLAQRGRSTLWAAGRNHSSETIKLLLERGVDPNDYGSGFNETKTYHRGLPLSPLANCMKSGRFEDAEVLLDFGADPHALHWKTETCLVKAATFGSCSLVQKLLEKGVDVNETFRGKTAFDIAVWRGNKDLMALLLGWGAKPIASAGHWRLAPKAESHSEVNEDK